MKPIRIFDVDFNLLTEIDNYKSLIVKRNFRTYGQIIITINMNLKDTEYLQTENYILVGNDTNKFGIIKARNIQLTEDGMRSEILTITAYTTDYLFTQRLTYASDTDDINSNAETVIKHYLENNVTNPVDANRKFTEFTLKADQSRGIIVDWSSRFKNLSDELKKISYVSDMGIECSFNGSGIDIDVIESVDKTISSGNPILFSYEYDNIANQNLNENNQFYKNFAYVGGSGTGSSRVIQTVGTGVGIERIETFVNQPSLSDPGELTTKGEQSLMQFNKTFNLDSQILNQGPFEYEVDWNLGNKVTTVNKKWNVQRDVIITSVTEIYENNRRTINVSFGDDPESITKLIKDKFENVENEVIK